MRSKTLNLINHYYKIIKEQDENGLPPENMESSPNNVEPDNQDTMPLTSQGENELIKIMVDAAIFAPNADQSKELMDMQSLIQTKKVTNLREDILPRILSMLPSIEERKTIPPVINNIEPFA